MRDLQASGALRILSWRKVLAGFAVTAVLFLVFFPWLISGRVEKTVAREWLTPLDTGKRTDWSSLAILKKGKFLSSRAAYAHLQKHVHTGIDVQNRHRGGPGERVYSVAKGKVFDVKIQGAGTRVTICHLLPNGELVYSSYIHLADVRVKRGRRVDSSTILGRRFNREELKRYGAYYNHLHFQIHRGKFNASDTVLSKTKEEVLGKFYAPDVFLREFPKNEKLVWKDWLREKKISRGELLWIVF